MPFCLAFWHSTCLLTCSRLNQISRLVSVPTSFPFVGAQAAMMWKKHHATESSYQPWTRFFGHRLNSVQRASSWGHSGAQLYSLSSPALLKLVLFRSRCCESLQIKRRPKGGWLLVRNWKKTSEKDRSFRNRLFFGACAATHSPFFSQKSCVSLLHFFYHLTINLNPASSQHRKLFNMFFFANKNWGCQVFFLANQQFLHIWRSG